MMMMIRWYDDDDDERKEQYQQEKKNKKNWNKEASRKVKIGSSNINHCLSLSPCLTYLQIVFLHCIDSLIEGGKAGQGGEGGATNVRGLLIMWRKKQGSTKKERNKKTDRESGKAGDRETERQRPGRVVKEVHRTVGDCWSCGERHKKYKESTNKERNKNDRQRDG